MVNVDWSWTRANVDDHGPPSIINDDDEPLDVIKAKTMYNMVEPLDGGATKLLLLSNNQAKLLADDEHLSKMLIALGVEKGQPQLVINLLQSAGFRTNLNHIRDEKIHRKQMNSWAAGRMHDSPPFLNRDDERNAEGRLDAFMENVLIPLAAQVRAQLYFRTWFQIARRPGCKL